MEIKNTKHIVLCQVYSLYLADSVQTSFRFPSMVVDMFVCTIGIQLCVNRRHDLSKFRLKKMSSLFFSVCLSYLADKRLHLMYISVVRFSFDIKYCLFCVVNMFPGELLVYQCPYIRDICFKNPTRVCTSVDCSQCFIMKLNEDFFFTEKTITNQ